MSSSGYPPPPAGPDEPSGANPYEQAPPPHDPYGQVPQRQDPYGQAPQPGGGYGSMPGPAGGPMQPAANVGQPPSIALVVKLMYAGAALSLIGVLLTFFSKDQMRAAATGALAKQGKALDATTIDTAVNVGIATAVIVGLIGVALWLWMASANGRGRSWARLVATVLGGLNIVFTLIGFTGETGTAMSKITGLISVLLAIAILVLLWRRESSAFYAAHSARTY